VLAIILIGFFTDVNLQFELMGATAVILIVDRLETGRTTPERVELGTRLVERDSTK